MKYKSYYQTKENYSDIVMFSDGKYLTGLYFVGYKMGNNLEKEFEEKELAIFEETKRWLDIYFEGEIPNFNINYKIGDITPFRKEVLERLLSIPYGETVSYGKIAKEIALKRGIKRMSAQAVGGAVGCNPISIIIPCHRVIGSDGSIIGYSGGIVNKIELLRLEKVIVDNSSSIVKY